MGAEIDSLEIQVQANAARANQQLDSLVSKLNRLTTSLRSVDANGLSSMAAGVQRLATSMQSMKSVGTADFSRLTKNLDKLGAINASGIHQGANALLHMVQSLNGIGTINFDASGLVNLANAINRFGSKASSSATANLPQIKRDLIGFVQGLNGIGSINFDMNGLANLVSSISRLGGKSASNAIPNIQQLGAALTRLIQSLSTAPRISQNIIQMTNALANLASNGQRVGSAARGMVNSFTSYDHATQKAISSSKGFASAIGMLYARFWLLKRAFGGLWKSIKSSMDYIETLNYFNVAFNQVGEDNIAGWKKSGYDSAEAYINSFSDRAKQLTSKLTGFKVEDDGTMVETGMKNLGLDPNMVMNYQAQYAQMANSMGLVAKSSMNVSEALVMLGADWASLKNLDMETSFKKMSSALAGQIRPARELGIDISVATLQTYALKYGLKGAVSAMNQATKVQLRMIAMLNQSKVAFGDMANTIGQPANQLRLLQQNFSNLARAVGNIFLPVVATVLPYINALVIALRRLFIWIGSLIGVKMSDFSSSIGGGLSSDMEDLASGAGDLADNMGSAANNAKKAKGQVRGWDELNNQSSNESGKNGSGGGAGGVGLLDDALAEELAAYQKAWDEAFANMEHKADTFADNIAKYFKKIWDIAEPTREALKRLWNEGLAQLGNFVWTGLKDFYYDFLVPLGTWALGEGLPRFVDITNNFIKAIDWDKVNESLRNFWQALEPFAESIGNGLLDFYEDLTGIGAEFINSVVPGGLNGIADALNKISPETAEKIGYALGVIATALFGFKIVGTVIKAFELLSKILGGNVIVKGVSSIGKALGVIAIFGKNVAGVIEIVAGGFGTWGQAIAMVFPKLASFASSVSGVFSGIVSVVSGIAAALGISLGALVAIVVAAVAAIVAVVLNWDDIKTFFTSTLPNWWNGTVIPFFEKIPGWFSGVWKKVCEFFSEHWNSLIDWFQGVPEKIKTIIDSILTWFDELPGKIGYAIGFAIGTIAKWVLDVINIVKTEVPKIISSIVSFFVELPGKIYTAIITFKDKVITWGNEVWNTFSTKVTEIINNVVNYFKELPGKIYEKLVEFKNTIVKWKDDVISWTKEYIPQMLNSIIEWFNKLPGRLVEIGKNMLRALWNGILSMGDWLKQRITDFFGGIGDGIVDAMGIGKGASISINPVQGFAAGGFPSTGQLFIANEAGPELVGQFGNRTAVAGSGQITDGIALAVTNANDGQNQLLREQNELLRAILSKPVIDKGDIVDAWKSGAKEYRGQTGRQLGTAY